MATSGSITTNKISKSYFYVNWSQASQSIPNNTTTINWTAGIYTGTSTSHDYFYSNAVKIYNVNINGSEVYSGGTWSNIKTGGSHNLASGTTTISHNSDGTKSFSISISAYTYSNNNYSGSGTGTLNTIPRYFSQTPTLTYSSKTETSITFTWKTSETCSAITWSRTASSVSGVPGTSGSVTFSSLTANTSYSIYGTFKRSDSGLTTNSATNTQSTYNYPYVTGVSASNLTIGNQQTVNLYNPLSRTCTVYMKKDSTSGTQFYSGTTSTTSISFTPTASTLYNSIPNSASGNAVYYCSITSPVSKTSGTFAGTYSCSQSACTPTLSTASGNLSYKDTNSTTTALTGNDQYIIQNNGKCTVTIANAATAKNGASISSYVVTLGSQSKTVTAIGTSNPIDFGTIDANANLSLSYYAVDSRGFQSATSSAVTVNIVAWQPPSVTINQLERANGYSSTVTLKVTASISPITIGSSNKNTLKTHSYSYTGGSTGSGTWTSGTAASISNINTDNDYTFTITYADALSGTKTITRALAKGVAILMIDPTVNGVGVNYFPSSEGLFVKGVEQHPGAIVGQSSNTATNYWYKVATLANTSSQTNSDYNISFKISQGYNDSNTRLGILTAHIRTSGTTAPAGIVSNAQLTWEYALSGINPNHFVLAYLNDTINGGFQAELWVYQNNSWGQYHFDVLTSGERTQRYCNKWKLEDNVTASGSESITSGYTQITSTVGTLYGYGKIYSGSTSPDTSLGSVGDLYILV